MTSHFAQRIDSKPVSAREFADLILGEKIGSGMSRDVYLHKLDPTLVIKHETGQGFQNIIEYKIWEAVQWTPLKKWFAEVVDISPNGLFLVMKKAERPLKKQYPKKLPGFFTDIKYENFGVIGKQFVAIDYGSTPMTNWLHTKKALKAVEWAG